MIVYLLTKFNFFKNDHIHMHQHSLLARAFFKNLSVGTEQSTKREHTPCVFPPLGLHFVHFVNRFLDAQRYIIL